MQTELNQTIAHLRETQTKFNRESESHLQLQYDFDRLTEDLNKSKLKVSELTDLIEAK